MLKNQKQRCRQPVVASLMSAEEKSTASRPRKRQIIEELSKQRLKVIQTKSDNNHDRKTIAEKKLRSLNLVPKDQVIPNEHFDQYQIGSTNQTDKPVLRQIQARDRYNQCLRDDSSSSNYGEIVSHYRQSKSRYKKVKDKAKKLIQNMIHTSKNNHDSLTNQLNLKMHEMMTQLPNHKNSNEQYCMTDKFAPKSSTASGSTYFKPKVEKCSTLRFGSSKSPVRFRSGDASRPLSNSRQHRILKPTGNSASQTNVITNPKQTSILSPKPESNKNSPPSSQQQIPTQRSMQTVIASSESLSASNANPLVLQGKHLFEEYGIPTYNRIPTQKQIIEQTENACRQVSRQLPITRKQTQKLITRARQKNKKIIGKLKEMKERRSAFRNSQSVKNDLTKSASKFSKFIGNTGNQNRSSMKSSVIQSRLQQLRSSHGMQQSSEDFLGLESNLHSSSVIAFNQEIRQKILIHLETIKTIADYAQSFTKIYQDCNEWQDLIFLLYKKYYMQRFKIYHILKSGLVKMDDGTVIKDSPFVFDFCALSDQELDVFRQSKQQVSIELQLQRTNKQVLSALRQLYNKFIQKTGSNPTMNMWQLDNFSQQILQDINQEINMLIESCGKSQKIKQRINQAIQVGLMIAHLEGYELDQIEGVVVGDVQGKEYFEKYYKMFLEIFDEEGR